MKTSTCLIPAERYACNPVPSSFLKESERRLGLRLTTVCVMPPSSLQTLEVLCVSAGSIPAEEEEEGLRQSRLQAVERVSKATVLGTLLLPLLAVVSNSVSCTLQMANTLQRRFTSLAQLAAQVCLVL